MISKKPLKRNLTGMMKRINEYLNRFKISLEIKSSNELFFVLIQNKKLLTNRDVKQILPKQI
jgi:uncharacterized FlaG/YvyC family protein